MRKHPIIFFIFLLMIMLMVDSFVFKGLQQLISFVSIKPFKNIIDIGYWVFSLTLTGAILWLLFNTNNEHTIKREQFVSYVTGSSILTFIPKIIFSVFYGLASFFHLIGMIMHRILPENTDILRNTILTDSENFITYFGAFAAFVPFPFIFYGMVKGKFDFKVIYNRLPIKNLPKPLSDLKIVHISDLHLGSFNNNYKAVQKAVDKINMLKADFIFFTGDIVNNYAWETEGWQSVLGQLQARLGKYSILGNHDYGDYGQWETVEAKKDNLNMIKEFHQSIGFKLLLNENEKIDINGKELCIIGVENWGKPPFTQYGDLETAMRGVNTNSFKILLSHDPSHWDEEILGKTNIDLTLSGHTHGMQFGIGFGKKKWSPIQNKYPRWGGLYTKDDQHLYVNTGLGYIGFPGRVGMPPEITYLQLGMNSYII